MVWEIRKTQKSWEVTGNAEINKFGERMGKVKKITGKISRGLVKFFWDRHDMVSTASWLKQLTMWVNDQWQKRYGIEGVVEPKYEAIRNCGEKWIAVKENGKWWLLDLEWNMLIEPKYDEISYGDWDLYIVESWGKKWIISESWEEIVKQCDKVFFISNKRKKEDVFMLVKSESKRKLVSDKWIVLKEFDGISYELTRRWYVFLRYQEDGKVEKFSAWKLDEWESLIK